MNPSTLARWSGRGLRLLAWLLPLLALLWTAGRAPDWLEPDTLRIALAPGQERLLGRATLQAPQADEEHVRLRRAADGAWWLANVAAQKQVLWQPARGGDHQPTREWPLQPGATFAMGRHLLTVLMVAPGELLLGEAARRWRYDGVRLYLDGRSLPECYPGWRERVRRRLAGLGLRWLVQRPLRLGGGVWCADRLGLADVPVDTAVIAAQGDGFVLRPGLAGRPEGTPVTVAAGTPQAESLWLRTVPLTVGDRLIIGRTGYRVAAIAPDLELAVTGRAQRWPADAPPPATHAAVSVRWQPLVWLWPQAGDLWLLLGPLGLGLGAALLAWRGRAGVAGLALAGLCLGLYLERMAVPVLWPYLLAWAALGVWLWRVRSPWSATLLSLLALLWGAGLLTLLQLGTGAAESGWPRYGAAVAALGGGFGWLCWGVSQNGRGRLQGVSAAQARLGLRALGMTALLLLLAQVIWGDETGWAGLQPVELTQLALVSAAAYALTLQVRCSGGPVSLWLRYLGPLVLLVAVSGFALVFLRDFSPLVLLLPGVLLLAVAYQNLYPQAARRWLGRGVVAVLALMLVLAVVLVQRWPQWVPAAWQSERIRAWVAPQQYPHASYQLRRALEEIRIGGWRGAVWKEAVNGRAMAIPAVESDFTPAFFLNRYGGRAGLLLMGLQALFIVALLTMAHRTLDGRRRGDPCLTLRIGFTYFTLYGGAALMAAHLLVSWGTNLGFLPVMGQPMSLLSAGGSHLVLFVLPIVALAVASEEERDAKLS